ncbi:hypothetical protein EYR36_007189 [Pleurotus pulmonarius]|nr:hypothetical protein EYR36_007189 [Pleurotus pulmonarius]
MSEIYTNLQVSPRKKRCLPGSDDESVLTPKKLRRALQHAISHALATCAVSPTSDTGIVRNVLNHLSLSTYAGLTTQFDIDDLRRLCWLWEWDGEEVKPPVEKEKKDDDDVFNEEEDNPFLEAEAAPAPKEWTRGAMGFVISTTTHHSRREGKRVPAYGIGIEVEMDIDKDMGGGMAAVARWTAASEKRRADFQQKLKRWVELHPGADPVPTIPLADLPELPSAPKTTSLTRLFAAVSPKASSSSPSKLPVAPPSPSRSSTKSPTKSNKLFSLLSPTKKSTDKRPFPVPSFPVTPSSRAEKKNSVVFPVTPSSHHGSASSVKALLTPRTPTTSFSDSGSECSTPTRQRTSSTTTTPTQTPSTLRRQALYERVRQKSLTSSPTKTPSKSADGSTLSRDQMLKLSQDEMRRRCLLGRLDGVADSVWMLFSNPTGSMSTPSRKRKALRTSEVATAIVKSSPVPISASEANESINMLTTLCPFFLRKMSIGKEEWLEMPAPTSSTDSGDGDATSKSPTKSPAKSPTKAAPPSPGGKDSVQELLTRSPRRVKRETGGLREVRQIIRRELSLAD